ncbi:MAG: 2-keto-4-pentenoate hydratase, partial [Woeseiaceae bacterium]|nr:2-keto-4-pentenoate hydratase [Woeseiaceae bacterium]
MKLASLKNGRDGELVVVSKDLTRYLPVGAESFVGAASRRDSPTLQSALDNWSEAVPLLHELASRLADPNVGESFDAAACDSPLPRAYQWADGSAYVNHVELVRKARGAEMPESFWTDPLMYQGGSD